MKRLWSWGNSVSGGLRWLSQLLRVEIVWALELLSGNILSPDVWVRTAPVGVLRKQCFIPHHLHPTAALRAPGDGNETETVV